MTSCTLSAKCPAKKSLRFPFDFLSFDMLIRIIMNSVAGRKRNSVLTSCQVAGPRSTLTLLLRENCRMGLLWSLSHGFFLNGPKYQPVFGTARGIKASDKSFFSRRVGLVVRPLPDSFGAGIHFSPKAMPLSRC